MVMTLDVRVMDFTDSGEVSNVCAMYVRHTGLKNWPPAWFTLSLEGLSCHPPNFRPLRVLVASCSTTVCCDSYRNKSKNK